MERPVLDYQALAMEIVSQIRKRTPKVTGNLTRSTKYYTVGVGDIWGHIVIDAPYAQFVDYGHLDHPRSVKLERDYLYVEKSINQILRIAVRRFGGTIR